MDVGAGRAGAAGEGDVPHERGRADGAVLVLRDAQAADDPAVDDRCQGGLERVASADGLDDPVDAVAPGQIAHARDAFFTAFGDDVVGTEVAAEVGAGGVAAHEDDALGPQTLGGDHRTQADRAVPDDQHRVPWADAGRDGTVVARGHHVRQGQQGGQQRRVGGDGQLDQGAVGVRDAHRLALAAVDTVESVPAAVPTGDLQALGAVIAGVVAVRERGDDQVTRLETCHVGAGLLDHAEELVTHRPAGLSGRHRLVGPQVAAAHTRPDGAHEGIGGLLDLRVGTVLDPDVSGSVHHCCTHERSAPEKWGCWAWVSVRASAGRLPCGCRRRPVEGH